MKNNTAETTPRIATKIFGILEYTVKSSSVITESNPAITGNTYDLNVFFGFMWSIAYNDPAKKRRGV